MASGFDVVIWNDIPLGDATVDRRGTPSAHSLADTNP
jgi:hypothetical protein